MKKLMTLVMSAALAFFASASLLAVDKYTVTIDKNVEGCKSVSFESKQFNEGAKATIKAVADKGYVFAGWDNDGVLNEDPRSATATFTVDTDYDFTPRFVKVGEDYLNAFGTAGLGFLDSEYYDFTPVLDDLEVGVDVEAPLPIPSGSFPTVSFKGLPAGVKFDAKKLCFTGKPTKAGIYEVTMSVKNASGYTAEQSGVVMVNYPVGDYVSFDENMVSFSSQNPFDFSYPKVGDELPAASFISDKSGSGFKSIKVSGLPAGLKYETVGNTLSGKFTKAGDYAIVATVKYLDATLPDETISMLVRVLPESLTDESKYYLMVGDDESYWDWGLYASAAKAKLSASGLPAGLKLVKDTYDEGDVHFYVEGTPTKAGFFEVKFTETWYGEKSQYTYLFYVQPAPSFYLDVQSADEEMGTVTGAGVYQYNTKKVTIKATPKSGYSFSYWHEVYGDDEYDYSDASMSETADYFALELDEGGEILPVSDWSFSVLTANFIAKTDDYCELDLFDGGNPTWDLRNGPCWDIAAISGSKATVTAKGLPAGIKLFDDEELYFESDGRICQEWYLEADFTKLKPGTYDVQLSAKNLSGKAGQTKTLTIVISEMEFDEIIPFWDDDFILDAGVKYDVPANPICDADGGVKLTAKGLPAGLKLTQKDGAYYFTGTPTQGGAFEVKLTAKQCNFSAETTVMVYVNMPRVSVANYCDSEETYTGDVCGKVTGSGIDEDGNIYMQAGKKVSLKATASSDHVFAGWWDNSLGDYVDFDFAGVDFRSPSISFVMGTGDYNLEACFVEKADDLANGCEISLFGDEFGKWVRLDEEKTNLTIAVGAPYILDVFADSYSLPTFKVKGLPAGLKFDAKTATISGVPTKAGTFTVTVDATNVSKATDQLVVAITVLPVADWAIGTFNGGITLNDNAGIFTATVKNTGAISGKVTINGKSASFSAKNFDYVEIVGMKHKNNSVSWRSLDDGRIDRKATGSTTHLGQVGVGGAALTSNGSFEFFLDPDKDFVDCDPYVESYGVEVTVKIDGEEIVLPLNFAELNKTVNYEAPDFSEWNGETYRTSQFTFRYTAAPAITEMSNQGDDVEAKVPAGAQYWVEGAQLGCCYCSDLFLQSTKASFDAKTGYDLDSVIKSSHDLALIKEQLAFQGAEFVSLTKAGVLKIKDPAGKSYTANIAVTDVVVNEDANYTNFIAPIALKDGVVPLYFSVGEWK